MDSVKFTCIVPQKEDPDPAEKEEERKKEPDLDRLLEDHTPAAWGVKFARPTPNQFEIKLTFPSPEIWRRRLDFDHFLSHLHRHLQFHPEVDLESQDHADTRTLCVKLSSKFIDELVVVFTYARAIAIAISDNKKIPTFTPTVQQILIDANTRTVRLSGETNKLIQKLRDEQEKLGSLRPFSLDKPMSREITCTEIGLIQTQIENKKQEMRDTYVSMIDNMKEKGKVKYLPVGLVEALWLANKQ